ncbi:hypothetical protein CAL25_21725 [Bordetella genomosp. 5]|uniref:Uncharacterized protein n=1 Tax=Bordetella genomosp. 5 TaxID=1395608 RepID=A0A261T963_9BORD|nr:hypothetical protein CAL25_21725 [Bordetella genomosp. 5]
MGAAARRRAAPRRASPLGGAASARSACSVAAAARRRAAPRRASPLGGQQAREARAAWGPTSRACSVGANIIFPAGPATPPTPPRA